MPCNSDYLAPTGREEQSRKLARLLMYLLPKVRKKIPPWVARAAECQYGDEERIDEMVVMLCREIRSMTPQKRDRVVYDPHSYDARRLADFWEEHQIADRRRARKKRRK